MIVTNASKNLIRFAPRESQGGNQDVGVQNDPHEAGQSVPDVMHESIHIIFGTEAERLGAFGGCLLHLFPAPFLQIEPQSLAYEVAFRTLLFACRACRVTGQLWGK